MNTYVVIIDH